jgi:DNA-binding transcriptional LysR family regulator
MIGSVLDTRRLQVLVSVVSAGSVTMAAQRLGLTPSSVSQQMAQLEREVGLALLEKAGRGIRPTAAGTTLAEHATAVLSAVGDAEAAMEDLREGRSGRVRVLSFTSAGDSILPAAVSALRRSHPGLHVATRIGEVEEAYEALGAGLVDVALVLEPFARGEEPDDGLSRAHLLDDPFRIMLPSSHRFASRASVELLELAGDGWVETVGANGFCRDVTEDVCRRAGFRPSYVAQAAEFSATQAYVATGIGVALVPVLALGMVRDGVVVRPLRTEPEPRHVWLLMRAGAMRESSVSAVVRSLRAAAASHRASAPGTARSAPARRTRAAAR